MSADNVLIPDAEATACFYCGKETASGHWFARLRQGGRRVLFCCPRCLEMFWRETDRSTSDWSSDEEESQDVALTNCWRVACKRRINTLAVRCINSYPSVRSVSLRSRSHVP